MIENGLGLQAVDVPLDNLIMIGKAIFGDEIVYLVALAVIKVAILVMYCRVFPLGSFRIASWIIGSITVVWSVLFIFLCEFVTSVLVGHVLTYKQAFFNATQFHEPGICSYLANA